MSNLTHEPGSGQPSPDAPKNESRRRFAIGTFWAAMGLATGVLWGFDRSGGEARGRVNARAELLGSWHQASIDALRLAEEINFNAFNPGGDSVVDDVEIYNGTVILGQGRDANGTPEWYAVENPVILARDSQSGAPLIFGSLHRTNGTPQEPARWRVHMHVAQRLRQDKGAPQSSIVDLGVDPISVEIYTVADQDTTRQVGALVAYASVG